MADRNYVESLMGGLDNDTKRCLKAIFDYLLKGNLRVGRADASTPSVNLAGHFYSGTTPAVAGTEFTITHRFNQAPYVLIPVLPLDQVGAKVVPLTVTKAADGNRIYLSSTVADAPFTIYLEG